MCKVFIWGTGFWGEKCFHNLLPEVDIIGFVESKVSKNNFRGKKVISGSELVGYDYDYVILANTHEDEIQREFTIDSSKVLIYRQNPRPDKVQLFTWQIIDKARSLMPYLSIECEGMRFLYNKTDFLIPDIMFFYQEVWSKNEMDFFWKEAPRRQTGIFMDIGANIGTTSIYFKKRLAEKLSYIAFEPVKENYKIFKMNCILNDCEDIIVENIGISDTEGIMGYTIVESNYGGCRETENETGNERCEIMRLDNYIEKRRIFPKDISYVWMDIEGHEVNAIKGAKKLLQEADASLFLEYNAREYKMRGQLEIILKELQEIYSTFLCFEQYMVGKTKKRHINELVLLADEMEWRQCNVLFIK